jgi:hypothetical protein
MLIDCKTGNLRAMQLLLGHKKTGDALAIAVPESWGGAEAVHLGARLILRARG